MNQEFRSTIEAAMARLCSIGDLSPDEAEKCFEGVREDLNRLDRTEWPRGIPLHFEYCRGQVMLKEYWQANATGRHLIRVISTDYDGWRQWILANPEAHGTDWPVWFDQSEYTGTTTK